ncbi:MAG: SMP-30/gluconolactonase/LRE family protein [Gemmatimonadota bacterium]
MRTSTVLLIGLLLAGCTGADDTPDTAADSVAVAPAASDSLSIAGFSTPESVLYDEVGDVYLVSNINGAPIDKDDNGFISRVSPDGTVQTLKWIDGAADNVTLNAPKGLAIVGDTLFVADIDSVRAFNRNDGSSLAARGIPGVKFLNDLATGMDGKLYVSDTGVNGDFSPAGTDAVYRFDAGRAVAVSKTTGLHGPNGLAIAPEGVLIVPFGAAVVHRVKADGGAVENVVTLPTGGLDGLVRLLDGSLLVSSWEGKAVYKVDPQGQVTTVLENMESPADIGYDTKRGRLLIPVFNQNRVEVRKR